MGYNQPMSPAESKQRSEGEAGSAPQVPRGDGVDLGLIRWMLSLTPRERLEALQQAVNGILELRHAKERN
jgi:hypothetical protein